MSKQKMSRLFNYEKKERVDREYNRGKGTLDFPNLENISKTNHISVTRKVSDYPWSRLCGFMFCAPTLPRNLAYHFKLWYIYSVLLCALLHCP